MEIVDKNRLIDIFMESKGEEILYKDQWGGVVWGDYKPHSYHSDWNLLMDVVEKIESMSYVVATNQSITTIDGTNKSFKFITGVGDNKKQSVYNAITSFIGWYDKH